ncbi:hypothetical protein BWK59_14790 [Flavobacterium davisii]|uniref:Uncharacterized protein n=1 Tax=Flavobacterium davisii TaxID=2906077 RepID=A0A246GEW0_9FLAO|nr:hypothetical protein [Flavobacterium davisii]OWP82640.1 hypothetical protein BWK59_14790 [Flavobacterium davisii]QYS89094.1 hypothetical protein JJC05_01240 [Flavobacterium davisii]
MDRKGSTYLKLFVLAEEAKAKFNSGEITQEELDIIATELIKEGDKEDKRIQESFLNSFLQNLIE